MLATRIIPTLLYKGHTLYKGQKFQSWRSVGSAMQAVQIHQARGVDELIMLDIGATPEGRGPDLKMVEQMSSAYFMPITVGGGVRSVNDVRDLLNAGADKISVKTNTDCIPEASSIFGSQAVVAALDILYGYAVTHGISIGAVSRARMLESLGAGEILLTSVGREGTMQGYDLDLIREVSQAVNIPVIAHGGCGTYQHMLEAIQAGASAVAAGSMFQFTDATPQGAAQYLRDHGVEVRQ